MRYNTLKFALAAIACLSVMSLADIPVIRITTQNNQDPTVNTVCTGQSQWGMCMGTSYQEMKYVIVTNFQLTDPNNPQNNLTLTLEPASSETDSIRIRGNSTAGIADKRPYRIKFNKKQGLFGKEKAKSWVLLANYYDVTFALNAIAFRLGQKLGLAYTPSSQHVNLYLNNQYKGIYQLTEQIQVNPGRVDIDKEQGFLVEFDYHDADPDEVKFTSARYNMPTFIKSPEVESNFNVNNPAIKWVKDEIDALTNKMYENGFPENGYRNLINLESFAKYTLIQLLMDNYDFNNKTASGGGIIPGQDMFGQPGSNYAYKDVGDIIHAGPLWDFDLAAGVQTNGFPAHYQTEKDSIRPRNTFYRRLFEDKVFLAKWRKLWDKHQTDFNAIPAFIDSIANVLKDDVANNKYANPSGGMGGGSSTLNRSTYETEVSRLKNWWNSRMTHFSQEINKMNIDTSKDIPDPTPIFKNSLAQQHGMFIRGRSINIHTQEPSSVKLSVFDLSGKTLFSGNIGTGSNITWNSERLGMSKVLMVVVEAKGTSGKTYKFTGRILP